MVIVGNGEAWRQHTYATFAMSNETVHHHTLPNSIEEARALFARAETPGTQEKWC